MSWIGKGDVAILLQRDLSDDIYIDKLIAHAQSLAELEIGEQADPSAKLKALLAQIVARMWQAGQSAQVNPAGLQGETTGPFNYQDPRGGVAGLGLTKLEKKMLAKAVGKTPLWVQPTSRSQGLETPPLSDDRRSVDLEQMIDVSDGEPVVYFAPDDLPDA